MGGNGLEQAGYSSMHEPIDGWDGLEQAGYSSMHEPIDGWGWA